MRTIPLLIIAGPTAIGKTRVAIEVAESLNGEIVGADSMQIYRYMDIGTAKPSPAERSRIPHHLLDVRDPDQEFSVAEYVTEATAAIRSIYARGRLPVLVGGSGLYIEKLLYGIFKGPGRDENFRQEMQALAARSGPQAIYERLQHCDPDTAKRVHPNDLVRTIRALEVFQLSGLPISVHQREATTPISRYEAMFCVLYAEREAVYHRINTRVELMAAGGLVDEVRSLYARGYDRKLRSMQSLGYKEIGNFLAGECDLPSALELMKRNTRRYAKRQLLWFRKYEHARWIERRPVEDVEKDRSSPSRSILTAWASYTSGSSACVDSESSGRSS
ncbi:tRNA (adenosine(37)-N6)-dimethylallyltransferase MiaA [candidate division KSB3 bacterium]|uniref:tRNA dimethylallyltransferase n=1 Tax=candidate division KSB3 bacterium TaxID=2044937 RepID=A0A2G6E920_9BACT|nr:MAG: tRNA (adenosine(37)-N6)-dimethylallyltransferase MiaA [candidate division KSB3 bacterium]